ncbi:hypothetical protein AGMMS49983_19820 [Clostridia bacterium]|nr:hypothetical protein AGMMS49983_19820 [Clostridia bacterium]
MGKKIKLGTIKVTRTVTVHQQVKVQHRASQQIGYEPIVVPASNQASQRVLSDLKHETKKLESVINKTQRRVRLPVGVYSPQVETLYSEFYKHSKPNDLESMSMYDVFISHASEDKAGFVDGLVDELQKMGIKVWYDTLEMKWGKGLREQIDKGIKLSKFSIIVLSKSFFAKKWPQRELDGIFAKEEVTGATPLPIWHQISFEEVYEFSPILSGLYSLSTDKYSILDICQSLKLILEEGDNE